MVAKRKAGAGNGSLLRALQDEFETFSRSRKGIARYLIDHLSEAPFMSAQELAVRTSTTSSTVVRFAQFLGFSGYSEMMKTAWEEHRLLSSPAETGIDGQLHFPVDDDFSGRAVRTDVNILEETMKRNHTDDFLGIVELIEKADTIVVAGISEAAIVVDYLRYYLVIMGLPVVCVTSSTEDSVAAVSDMGENSVLVAVGFKTAHQFLLRLIKAAGERGTVSVGISDNTLSEVAKHADRNLYCYLDSTSFAPSLVGAFSIVNALVSALYARNKRGYDANISRLHSLPLNSGWL